MRNRERFLRTMRFENTDHPPIWLDNAWESTRRRWEYEGCPGNTDLYEYFGLERFRLEYAGLKSCLYPEVEEKIISENEREIIKLDRYGRKVRILKETESMPEWLDFPVKNPGDLERVIAERFDLSLVAGRWPEDWEHKKKKWIADDSRDYLLFLDGGCYYGTLRNLAGVEYASYLFYDAPDLIDKLFEKIHLICMDGLKRVLPEVEVDFLGFGEDIAFKTSTLISPEIFKDLLLPRYKEVCKKAREYGLDIIIYDSDGNLSPLLELYFESGVDGFLPCEVAAGMNPVDLRKKYGKKIKMMGGIDKRELSKGKEDIRKEVMAKIPVIEQGGYIPQIDHSVSSDISFENYSYFINLLKKIYGI